MNNDELKKKIVDVLIKADENIRNEIIKATEEHRAFLTEDNQYYYIVADTLIAAGIGDVSEWKDKLKLHRVFVPKDRGDIKVLYGNKELDEIIKERDEYKHRAEVAERALFLSAKEIEYLNGDFDSSAEFFAKEKVIPYFMKKAEKELAEERKDD